MNSGKKHINTQEYGYHHTHRWMLKQNSATRANKLYQPNSFVDFFKKETTSFVWRIGAVFVRTRQAGK
jgi:hypothetical protein